MAGQGRIVLPAGALALGASKRPFGRNWDWWMVLEVPRSEKRVRSASEGDPTRREV